MRVKRRRRGTPWNKGKTKVKPKLCLCGCGQYTKVHKYRSKKGIESFSYQCFDFIKSHAKRGTGRYNPEIHEPRKCSCGCGRITNKYGSIYYSFIRGMKI